MPEQLTLDPMGDDKSIVSLIESSAHDLSVVNAARVSFGQRSEEMDAAAIGLLNYLMKGRHGSPFEHNMFTFHVRCPIAIAREWFRHRIGSFNEYSMRYKEAIDDFYIPAAEHFRTQVGRPGHYTFEPLDQWLASWSAGEMQHAYETCWETYKALIEKGVAKEVARMVLPVGIYTEFYWTVNARALMNFLSLRNSEFAQLEIRLFAAAVESIFGATMPHTHAAFVANGRTAP